MNVYGYSVGWITNRRGWVFLWASKHGPMCYIKPYALTNVHAGIDGLEFV